MSGQLMLLKYWLPRPGQHTKIKLRQRTLLLMQWKIFWATKRLWYPPGILDHMYPFSCFWGVNWCTNNSPIICRLFQCLAAGIDHWRSQKWNLHKILAWEDVSGDVLVCIKRSHCQRQHASLCFMVSYTWSCRPAWCCADWSWSILLTHVVLCVQFSAIL